MFCGTKIMNEATVVRKVSVDRSSEIIGLLNLSVLAMREGRFQKANDLLDDALRIDGMISTERLWRQPTL